MTLKNLYEETKNQNNTAINIGQYLRILIYWVLIMAVYIAIIWLGWNYLAKIFSLKQLTYIQTTVIVMWLNFVRHTFSMKGTKNNEK
jgi:hypothetical protein